VLRAFCRPVPANSSAALLKLGYAGFLYAPEKSRKPDAQTEFARKRSYGVWLFQKVAEKWPSLPSRDRTESIVSRWNLGMHRVGIEPTTQ
jgi:hypothetical protein